MDETRYRNMMKQRSVILRQHEAMWLAEYGEAVVVRKVKLQPCDFPYAYYGLVGGEHLFGEESYPDEGSFPVRCPFGSVGDELKIAIEQTYHDIDDGVVGPTETHVVQLGKAISEKIECRHIQSVTEHEAERTGLTGIPYDKYVGGYSSEHVEALCRDCNKRHGPDEWLMNGYYWFATLRRAANE